MIITKLVLTKIQQAPNKPGIYLFRDSRGTLLYVGKAIDLHKRLKSYVRREEDLDRKTGTFLKLAHRLSYITVTSDIEALLLEMNLIRTFKPKYNVISKDDKRPLLIQITTDALPRVRTVRQEKKGEGIFFGPFPSSYKLKQVMRLLRRIFPYCTCSLNRKHPCLYVDLGLCRPSPVTILYDPQITNRQEAIRDYKQNIRRLKLFIGGKVKTVTKMLQREMRTYSQAQEYEKAHGIKTQLVAIEHVLQTPPKITQYLENKEIQPQLRQQSLLELARLLNLDEIERIEGYDIANTSGTHATASMVVFEHGLPNTSLYRRFKIRDINGPNDPLMMKQILRRRVRHPEWSMPEVMLIDGGKTQVRAALASVLHMQKRPVIVGLAKRYERLVIPLGKSFKILSPALDSPPLTILRAVRNEAHRFATTYHKKLRQKGMLSINK